MEKIKIFSVIIGTLINLLIIFLSDNCLAEVKSQNKDESIRELIIRLDNEYLSLDETLKKFEKNIWDFPTTILNISILKRNIDIKITLIEILDNNKLLISLLKFQLLQKIF